MNRIERQIDHSTHQVGLERAAFIEPPDALVNPNKSVLDDVLCQLLVMNDEVSGSYSLDLVSGDQGFQSADVIIFQTSDGYTIRYADIRLILRAHIVYTDQEAKRLDNCTVDEGSNLTP